MMMMMLMIMIMMMIMTMIMIMMIKFSPQAQFFAKFFSAQKRVNHDQTDFRKKNEKLQTKYLAEKMRQKTTNLSTSAMYL